MGSLSVSGSMQFFIVVSCLLLFLNAQVYAQQPILESCLQYANYTPNSQFETNLNLLLRSLQSNGAQDGFYNTSTGIDPDTVYGLVQCTWDTSREDCRACLNLTAVEIKRRCPRKVHATLRYDDCILKYSDKRFFSNMDDFPVVNCNSPIVTGVDVELFNLQLGNLMGNLSRTAASRPNRTDFGSTDYISFSDIYGAVQCNRDLTPIGCRNCLDKMISTIPINCSNKQGAKIFSTTCYTRFNTFPFALIPFPPVFPPPDATTSPQTTNDTTNTEPGNGTGKGKSTNVGAILVPIIASVFLLSICAFLIRRRSRKNRRKTKPGTMRENNKSSNKVVGIGVPIVIAIVLLSIMVFFFCLRRKKKIEMVKYDDIDEISNADSLQVKFATVAAATDNFSDANKLGEGGFGAVYKGRFSDGQEVAVKRLSRNSGQGVEQFKNEVLLLAKLQHRNLVRLLGFCLEGDEKLLIYEFVPNASLDQFIFDSVKRAYLDWKTRYKIIEGIARGLLYLHVDSRHMIIHRDLKASNVLLDSQMNAKIADFGMAKLFVVDQTQARTSRIVGTYGYMAPEYVKQGRFSVKSDVFSLGVLILEIISGRSSYGFFESESAQDLLSYAWRHWQEGTPLELLDPALKERHSVSEVMRCLHIALLCVQEDLARRPTMGSIILTLNSFTVTLPVPERYDSSSVRHSLNEASITELEPR